MNYYHHYMQDYAGKTAHLSMLEDGAYRRLLDWQYTNERPIPEERERVYGIARAMTQVERKAVDAVLSEFFRHEGWQVRAYNEIEGARARINTAQSNGKKSRGRPRKVPQGTNPSGSTDETHPVNSDNPAGLPDEPKGNPRQKLPIPQALKEESKDPAAKAAQTVWDLWENIAGREKRGVLGKLIRDYGEDRALLAVSKLSLLREKVDPVAYVTRMLAEQPKAERGVVV